MGAPTVRWYEVLASVFAAFIGVQSRRNHLRDFGQTSPWAYIAVGLMVALVFVLTLYFIVHIVLAQVGL